MTARILEEVFAYCEECDWESEHLTSDMWGVIENQAEDHDNEYHTDN